MDASEEAQLEAAIKASLNQQLEPKPSGSTSAGASNSHPSSFITVDSGSEAGTDELETFSDSDDNSSRDATPQSGARITGSQGGQSPCHRNVPSGSSHSPTRQRSHGSRNHIGGASPSVGEPSGIPLVRQVLPGRAETGTGEENGDLPSTSSAQGRGQGLRLMDESENESSQGWRGSHANTPNSMEMLGGRSSEVHTVDSSSNSSLAGSTIVNVDDELDSESVEEEETDHVDVVGALNPSLWQQHFGDAQGKNSPRTYFF